MANPPTISLSQQPLMDVIGDGESFVIHSKEGFKRLNGAVFQRIQDSAQRWELRLLSFEESLPKTLESHRRQLLQDVQKLMEAHRADRNAHQISQAQVGLSKVQDYGIVPLASELEGYVLASDVRRFLTPAVVAPQAHAWDTDQAGIASKTAGRFRAHLGTSTALGHCAAQGGLIHADRYVAIGAYAEPVASGSVTLGSTSAQLYLAKPPATRADRRDFSQPKPLELGLDFVLRLNPVTAVQDLREDYVDYESLPIPPTEPTLPEPTVPALREGDEGYLEANYLYQKAKEAYDIEWSNYRRLRTEWSKRHADWLKVNRLDAVVPDGTWSSGSERTMLMGDDLRRAARSLSKIFTGVFNPGGKQPFLKGEDGTATQGAVTGLDIDHVRMEELVPVLVKAIQELHAYVHSDEFADGIAEKIYLKKRAARG